MASTTDPRAADFVADDFRDAIRFAPSGPRGGRPAKLLDAGEIVRRHKAGETVRSLARSLHVHTERIKAVLDDAGVEVRLGAWGKHHPRWKGGRQVTKQGYVRVTLPRDDPFRGLTDRNGSVFEHRYVMAVALGRALRPTETVHHIDGDRQNNDLDNLQLRFTDHGEGIALVCATCGSHDVRPEEL